MIRSNCLLSVTSAVALAAVLSACDGSVVATDIAVSDPIAADDTRIEEHPEEWSDTDLEFDVYEEKGLSQSGKLVTATPLANPASNVRRSASNARQGAVSGAFYWPHFAIHSVVLPDGDVMTYGATRNSEANGLTYNVWNRARGGRRSAHSVLPVQTATNLFCSAQTLMSNGQMLITGGDEKGTGGIKNDGIRSGNTYAKSQGMQATRNMAYDRWYPTVVPLANGEVLVHGGRVKANGDGVGDDVVASTPEVYSPSNRSFRQLTGAASAGVYSKNRRGWYYPRSWLNRSGEVFFFTPNSNGLFSMSTSGRGGLRRVGNSSHGEFKLFYPAVMYDKYNILTLRPNRVTTAISLSAANQNIYREKRLASIPQERIWSDATVLADGTVAVSGGSRSRQKANTAVLPIHLYKPSSNQWVTGASASVARLYHSTSVLLPDASVLMAGGGPQDPFIK